MKFTDEILKSIVKFGAEGKSFHQIATELNMTSDKLQDLRAKDEKLNDALTRAEFNRDQYMIDEIEKDGIKKGSFVQRDLYQKLLLKHNANSDNEIIIRRL
jgi:hypothetical protein